MNDRDIGTSAPPGPLRSLLERLLRPADDWASENAERGPRTLEYLLVALLASLVANAAVAGAFALGIIGSALAIGLLLAILAVSSLLVLALWYQVKRHLHEPLARLYAWALGMCTGDLSTRIPSEQAGRFKKLVFHINRLSEALEHLANEMDETVWNQTESLRQKNQSLETLYEVAAAISSADHIGDVLAKSADTLMALVGATGATVRLRGEDGDLEAVRRLGEDPPELEPAGSDRVEGAEVAAADGAMMVALTHQGENLGVIVLRTPLSDGADDPEKHKLLQGIGRHLGMAIAKSRVDTESKRLSILHERTAIAHELHDSLAQTLLSLRYQTDTLADSVRRGASTQAAREVERIRNTLGEANTELRELIANFRAPMVGRTLHDALTELVERFRRESAFAIYLQLEGELPSLREGSNLQIVRIVGEALANAQRHSEAKTVRILLRCGADDCYEVLVEDDGVGMSMGDSDDAPGEHIGLAVMSERARWLGGTLSVESEPGEGTRVQLAFLASEPRASGVAAGAS